MYNNNRFRRKDERYKELNSIREGKNEVQYQIILCHGTFFVGTNTRTGNIQFYRTHYVRKWEYLCLTQPSFFERQKRNPNDERTSDINKKYFMENISSKHMPWIVCVRPANRYVWAAIMWSLILKWHVDCTCTIEKDQIYTVTGVYTIALPLFSTHSNMVQWK